MEIIPRLTPNTLPDAATAARWRAKGIGLVHLMLDSPNGAEASLAALCEAGFAVQAELTDPTLVEEAAERLCGMAVRLFVPFDCIARPLTLMALMRRYGNWLGIALCAEEGAVRLSMAAESEDMLCWEAVGALDAAGFGCILYRDVAAESLPLGQVGRVMAETAVELYAAGLPDSPADLCRMEQMKLAGWLCSPTLLDEMLTAFAKGQDEK